MAKITACGDMLTITSDITLENFDKVKRFKPEALKLKDGDGNETFRIDFNPEVRDEVSNNGIVFHSVDAEGKMFLTTMNVIIGLHDDLADERNRITARYSTIIVKIEEVEMQIERAADNVNRIAEAVQDSIHICGEQEVNNG